MKYLPVVLTLLFVTYGQLIIKSEINKVGPIPTGDVNEMVKYFFHAISNIGIISGLFAAVCGAFSWMAAMSKFELSSIYPILSLNFVIVPLLSVYIFNESLSVYKIVGMLLIILGVYVLSRGT